MLNLGGGVMLDTKLIDLTVLDAYLAIAGLFVIVLLIALAAGILASIAGVLISRKFQSTHP